MSALVLKLDAIFRSNDGFRSDKRIGVRIRRIAKRDRKDLIQSSWKE